MRISRREFVKSFTASVLNAIYDATGHRFRSLPVTKAMIEGVLK